MFQLSLSTVTWKWPVGHLGAHAHGSGTLQAVSVPHKERSRPEKAGVDSSILSLGTTPHFSLSIRPMYLTQPKPVFPQQILGEIRANYSQSRWLSEVHRPIVN